MLNLKNTLHKSTALVFVGVMTFACLGSEVGRVGIDKQESQVQVSRVSFDHFVAVDASTGGVNDTSMKRVDGFLRGLSPKFGDRIEITGGSDAARADIVKHLKPLMLPVFETENTSGALQLILHRSIVSVPNCGDWSYDENPLAGNAPNRNFGCAHEANLARMLADPSDLIEGKASGAPYAASDTVAIEDYRKGEAEFDKGAATISELGGG